MDPLTIGMTVALLAGKKLVEKVGEQAGESGWGLANKLLATVRELFTHDQRTMARLEALEATRDPKEEEMELLAKLIDQRLPTAPDLAQELAEMAERVQSDPELKSILSPGEPASSRLGPTITITSTGDKNIHIGQAGGPVHIVYTSEAQRSSDSQ